MGMGGFSFLDLGRPAFAEAPALGKASGGGATRRQAEVAPTP